MRCWKCQNEITTADGITGMLICQRCFESEKLVEHLGPLKEREPRFSIPEIATWACDHNPDQINDPQSGIAAVTARHRKEQG